MSKKNLNKKEKEEESSIEEHDENLDTDSIEELADALEVKDPEERRQLVASISRYTSSPVPPPEILKGYDDLVEGGAKWLMEYTKDEQLHRHQMDKRELKYYSIGQIFGFTLGLVGIGGGIYLATTGAQWFGFATFFTSIVSLVSLFVYNKKVESKEGK